MPSSYDQEESGFPFAKYLLALVAYRRTIVRGTLVAVVVGAALGVWYYAMQSTRWIATLEFRPLFLGADIGRYPNGIFFGPSDVTDASILDQVYDANHLSDLCPRADFRSAFVVVQSSAALRFLDLEYQSKLSDPRLLSVERQKLQDDYAARRVSLVQQYQLSFVRPPACSHLNVTIVGKLMADALRMWADDSENRRGVMKIRVAVLTPEIFDSVSVAGEPLLVRADLIRSAITRVIGNIEIVLKTPGAEVVRLKDGNVSFAQVKARLDDLVQARLDPLVAIAGAGVSRDSIQWVQESLHVATMQQDAAQDRAAAVLHALQVYSGNSTVQAPGPTSGKAAGDVQTVTPQLDKSFIDKIVELSAANTMYRQQLTKQLVDASVDAVQYKTVVAHYQSLLDSLSHNAATPLSAEEVTRRLDHIVEEGKVYTKQFDDLYDEFGRVAFRPGPSMYRIENPIQTDYIQTFSLRNVLYIILAALVIAPILLAIAALVHFRLREMSREAQVARV